ncbi:hypothetical protein K737_300521 [Holospora undulata HU1]|uniref:Uncharacterized protein n=2 Tax=Holospora TaxID=44747 RepID=A0A061JHU2_9PROT|nr:hypothetical protein K737_300521 [Holospora undulata HU1]
MGMLNCSSRTHCQHHWPRFQKFSTRLLIEDGSEKKIDLDKLEEYVKENQDMTLKKAAQ